MNREEFEKSIRAEYGIIKLLADKNDCKTLLVNNKKFDKKAVLKLLANRAPLYEFLSSVSFANLPMIYGTVPLDDGFAVMEEYIDGVTVADVIEGGLYTYRGAKSVISDICDALSVIHDAGFVHRDIKPENIMISNEGRVVLIDFNVSRTVKEGKKKDTVVAGTIGYMSPEQYGVGQSDPRADVYSVGVLFNVMLTGCHPSEKLAKERAGRIVEKCCHIDPEKRYKSADELKSAL